MEYADLLTLFAELLIPPFIGFVWGRWERMTADVLEETFR